MPQVSLFLRDSMRLQVVTLSFWGLLVAKYVPFTCSHAPPPAMNLVSVSYDILTSAFILRVTVVCMTNFVSHPVTANALSMNLKRESGSENSYNDTS